MTGRLAPSTPRAAAVTRGTDTSTSASSEAATGSGTLPPLTRVTGAASAPNASCATMAATEAPQPSWPGFSSTTTSRPVRATEPSTAAASSGTSVRRSMTSASTPSAASSPAAARQVPTVMDSPTRVTSRPGRTVRAWPSGMNCSPSLISSLRPYSALCSNTRTGSSSRTAAASRPNASAGLAGEAIFRPGTVIAQFSTDWPCWLPKPSPPEPFAPRSTSGTPTCPPVM